MNSDITEEEWDFIMMPNLYCMECFSIKYEIDEDFCPIINEIRKSYNEMQYYVNTGIIWSADIYCKCNKESLLINEIEQLSI